MNIKNSKLNYRNNVGIVVFNNDFKVLCCKRKGYDNQWQFPQGGVDENENLTDAMYRELEEETSLKKESVALMSETKNWLYYQTPKPMMRGGIVFDGQRQKWYLLKLIKNINLDDYFENHSEEFCDYKWSSFEELILEIIEFKRKIYRQVFNEFKSFLQSAETN